MAIVYGLLVVALLAASLHLVRDTSSASGKLRSAFLSRSEESLQKRFLHLVEMAVTGSLYDLPRCQGGQSDCSMQTALLPYDAALRQTGDDWPVVAHTMVGHLRIQNLNMALHRVIADGVQGDFMELGVWRGGACIYAKAVWEVHHQAERRVFVLDAFESISGYAGASSYLENSMASVRDSFKRYDLLDDRVVFFKGLFKDSVPQWVEAYPDTKLAVLRIDGNFYDSYQDALYALWERVPAGGFVIFDDIRSHKDVMRCWQDFTADHGITEELVPIDNHSAYLRKTRVTAIDQSKKRPPQDVNKIA